MTQSGLFFAAFLLLVVVAYLLMGTFHKDSQLLPSPAHLEQQDKTPGIEWKEFVPESKEFKVSIPVQPHYAKNSVDIPNSDLKRRYEVYAAEEVNGTLFMVSVVTYPPKYAMLDTPEMLQELVNELVTSRRDNSLKEIKSSQYKAREALNFRIENTLFQVQGITFLVDHTAYILTYTARKNDFNPVDFQRFIDSFQLQ